jgi:hypothetical protein
MKEIRTIKMVEQTEVKFVADDGKEFIGENAEFQCKTYERQCNKTRVEEVFKRLDAKRIDVPMLDWYCEAADVWKIVLESERDYWSMVDYFKVVEGCCDNYTEIPKEFPCTMIVQKGWECFSDYAGNLKEQLEKALEQLK